MSANFEQRVIQLIADLDQNKGSENDSLEEIKTLLITANCRQIEDLVKQINMRQLFLKLNSLTNETNIELIVSVFKSILESLAPNYVINEFQNEIKNGLKSENDIIVELWLKSLKTCFSDDSVLKNNSLNTSEDFELIILEVIQLMANSNTSIATPCHAILLNIAKTNEINVKFFNEKVQKSLTDIKKINDIVRMRVYHLLITIANTSHNSLYKIENFGHLKDLLNDFNKDVKNDPLIALNDLQLISELGSTPFGTEYLVSSDIIKAIIERMVSTETDVFTNLLIPGYVKIFGTLAYNQPNILTQYPLVLNKFIALLKESNETLLLCVIEAIGTIGLKNNGKKTLNKNQEMLENYLRAIKKLLANNSPDIKSRALISLSQMISITEPDPNGEANDLTETWFNLLPDNRMSLLMTLCREPFLEVKMSALEFIRILATLIWGQKQLAAFPGFLDFILDRSTETTKNGKEAKFGIIRELVVSPFISLSFTREAVKRLKTYYNEGPYHVDNEVAVAFEGAD